MGAKWRRSKVAPKGSKATENIEGEFKADVYSALKTLAYSAQVTHCRVVPLRRVTHPAASVGITFSRYLDAASTEGVLDDLKCQDDCIYVAPTRRAFRYRQAIEVHAERRNKTAFLIPQRKPN